LARKKAKASRGGIKEAKEINCPNRKLLSSNEKPRANIHIEELIIAKL
jgi:hypothetical protein